MKKMKTILEEFNATCSQLDSTQPAYSLTEVLSPDLDFWSTPVTATSCKDSVPWSLKRSIAQAHLMVRRTNEEIHLLREEMERVIQYWKLHKEKLTATVNLYSASECVQDALSLGAQALLRRLVWEAEIHLGKATAAFTPILTSISESTVDFYSDSDDSDLQSDDDDD